MAVSESKPAKHAFREPNSDMIAAGIAELNERPTNLSDSALIRNIWRVMHDAAPA